MNLLPVSGRKYGTAIFFKKKKKKEILSYTLLLSLTYTRVIVQAPVAPEADQVRNLDVKGKI